MTTTLYHLTNAQNARDILADGEIIDGVTKRERTGAPSGVVAPEYDHLIDGVVWLTTNRSAKQAWQAHDFKWQVRFTLDVPDARPWREYADEAGLPDWYANMLCYPGTQPDTWYIAPGPITESDWKQIDLTVGERRIWVAGQDIVRAIPPVELAYRQEQAELRKIWNAQQTAVLRG